MRSERRRGPLRSPLPKAAPAQPSLQGARPARGARGARGPHGPITAAVQSQKLQKLLAQAGLGSRRAMETWIEAGRVTVNGKTASIGARVTPADRIHVDGREVRIQAAADTPRVLIYHKPDGEIVTRDDPQGRETVFERLPRLRGSRWLSIGRLDVNTSGLLLFTTSGALANSMMHPRFAVEREYAVRVLGRLSEAQTAQMLAGVQLAEGTARCVKLADEGGEGSNHWYRLVMTEGRNRVVRRLFEALGFTVSRLMRVRFGMLALPPRLKRGQFEELAPDQVRRLCEWLAKPVNVAAAAPAAAGERAAARPRIRRAANPRASE